MNGTVIITITLDNIQDVVDWVNSEFALKRVVTVNNKSLRSRDGNLVARARKGSVSFTVLGRSSGVTDLYADVNSTIAVR